MDVKNSFSGSKNFKKIITEVVHDSVSINRETDAIVYAKNTEDDMSIFVVGNIGAMTCLIAEMIVLMSKKSGFPISAILTTISHIIWNERGTLR
jgi:hypothetical protein